MANRYLFMLALPRSGSTLLAYVLDSHSRIHVAHEDSGRPDRHAPNREIFNLTNKVQAGYQDYMDRLLAKAQKDILVTSRFFARAHVQMLAAALGPHVPFIVLTRRHMWRVFKDADGRPRIVPFKQLMEFAACRRMVRRRYRQIEVAYEDLVLQPGEAFRRLCEWIGVDYEPGMLDYASFPHPHIDHSGNEKARRFGRIVDTVARDREQGPLIGRMAERLALLQLPRPWKRR